jgi:hypothetical protein
MKLKGVVAAMLLMAIAMDPVLAKDRDLKCNLAFTSSQWSAVYMKTTGQGTVTCQDGSSMAVAIAAKGIGITAGKWKITDGRGTFTHVEKIEDVLGNYLALSGDAGAAKAGTAQVLTKGKVSLALAGKGEGFDLGIAVSSFGITRLEHRRK